MKNYCVEYGVELGKDNFLGKGVFSKAYLVGERVILTSEDPAKECLALFCQDGNPHIPEIEPLQSIGGKDAYSMPYYQPLKATCKKAWKDYKEVKDLIDNASYVARQKYTCFSGYRGIFEESNLSELLKDALLCILDNMPNYTDQIFLEISPRNAKVGKDGQLVLLDIVGVSDKLEEYCNKKKRKEYYTGKS